jgi:hypothetical protein
MYSLFYGIIILQEIYAPLSKEEQEDYNLHNDNELLLVKIFVFNEVIVGSIVLG